MENGRRSYADPCGVARALDAVGERWALLVVRELSLGPRRFGQLRRGLPDVSPNVLSQRLRELEAAGVVRRFEPDPLATGAAYALTERGTALDPVLQALGRWGAAEPPVATREMSPVSFVRMLRVLVRPDARDGDWALVLGGEPFALRVRGGAAEVTRGRPEHPTAVLTGDVGPVRRLLEGEALGDLEGEGVLVVEGDRRAARRLPSLFRVPPGGLH
ncbi:winged helix-turn-helix transcriptional regulator [Phycicoccus flavus]|uniref:winged helix-turn-helix transcriptional regulator n=1 Tax=Phycicoccus flavus TaxID=2502783 RepID=UPI00197C4973|nr:helix-turn-helix domain-containing protein [Phycicoccus flavus]